MNKFRSLLTVALVAVAALSLAAFSAPTPKLQQTGLAGLIAAGAALGMTNKRTLKDLNLSVTKALPAAAAANYTDSIDTAILDPGRVEDVELLVEVPATPSLVDTKTITYTLKDSADNSTFAALADLATIVSTGASSAGAAAVERRFKIPIGAARYLRLDAAVLTAGGDNTAISYTLSVVF